MTGVPRVSATLFRVALRVATGGGSARDLAAVRKAVPGYDAGFAARVVLIRWYWYEGGAVAWHG